MRTIWRSEKTIFYHSSVLRWCRQSKSFLMGDRKTHILLNLYVTYFIAFDVLVTQRIRPSADIIQYVAGITRSILSKSSQNNTTHSLPIRARYGMSFVGSNNFNSDILIVQYGVILDRVITASDCIDRAHPNIPVLTVTSVNWTLRNKLQWNLNRDSYIFNQENALKNVFCKTAFISSRPQWVKINQHW